MRRLLLVLVAALALPASAHAADRICTETLIPTSDGVRLHAWVSRLAPDQARPVLFMMDSYARGGKPDQGPANDNLCPEVVPDDYVPQYLDQALTDRFTLVQVSYRGTGSSEGLFDMTGARTQQDEGEAIDWAAVQPWSTGKVFLAGESGTGFSQHHGLLNAHVTGALILTSCADMYRCFRRGGGYNALEEVYFAATLAGYNAGRDGRERMGTGSNPDPAQQLAALVETMAQTKLHDVDDEWWQQRSALDKLPKARVPVLYTTDNYDIVQPFDALQLAPDAHFVLGMGHQAKDSTVVGAGKRWYELVRPAVDRFVAHYGLGDANGAERDPRVMVLSNTGGWGQFRRGRMYVRGEDAWPLPATRFTELYLGDGTLGLQRPASAGSDTKPALTAAHADLRTTAFVEGDKLESDMRDDESSGLTYTTPELKRDLELTGPIALRLYASMTAPDLEWSVRLTDVWPDGASEWITDGYLRATLRHVDQARSLRDGAGTLVRPWLTYDASEPVPSGQPVRYDIELIGTSNIFRAGHRLRLDILPVASGETDSGRTGGAGTITVLRDPERPSSLSIPLVPDHCGAGAALAADTPAVTTCALDYDEALTGQRLAGPAQVVVTRRCPARKLVLRLRKLRGKRLRSAKVYVGKRLVRRVAGRRLRAVRLRVPARAFTVRVVGRTRSGQRVRQTRRYRACRSR